MVGVKVLASGRTVTEKRMSSPKVAIQDSFTQRRKEEQPKSLSGSPD